MAKMPTPYSRISLGNNLSSIEQFVFIVGNSRSGTSIVGSIIDAHPNMVCAHESQGSHYLWRGYNREMLLSEIAENAQYKKADNRASEGYEYLIEQSEKEPKNIRVVGDKIHNPALLMLHGAPKLLPSLRDIVGVPVKFVHVIRNPLDVISTMHVRSGAPVMDRLRWYFMHLDAAMSVCDAVKEEDWLDLHLENLILDPQQQISTVVEHVGEQADDDYFGHCCKRLFAQPKISRDVQTWPDKARRELKKRALLYPVLAPYSNEFDEVQ